MIKAFRDSTEHCREPVALAAHLAEDGYLFVRGLLPRDVVLNARRRCLEVCRAGGWLRMGTPLMEAIAEPSSACVDPEPAFLDVYKRMYVLEELHALQLRPEVIELFERLFGESVLAHPRLILRSIFPGHATYKTPPHQDFPHIQGTTETFSVWLPLSDCPIEMGGLTVAEGSHRAGVRPFKLTNGAGGMEVTDPLTRCWRASDVAAGDALIFHSMTVHKALLNRSARIRQSIDGRYQRASEPIVADSLGPYAGMGTWEDIYGGWRSSTHQYYWRALGPRVVDYDTRYYDERDAMAFDLAERGDPTARATLLRIIQRDAHAGKRDRASALLARLESAETNPTALGPAV